MPLPRSSRIVIVGGGIAGCSTAYHLALLGEKDVLLLEQGKLTCGTTWHAAGLVGQMRPNRTMTQMSKYGIELYASLEAETGLATGWKQCGGVKIVEDIEVTGVLTENGRVTGVKTMQGDVRCEVVVNCGGQWARQFGALA